MSKTEACFIDANVNTVKRTQADAESTAAVTPKLFGPSIEGVNNNTVWISDLTDPVHIDIFPWDEMLDGDVVVLTLSGRDAAGDVVPDQVVQHTLSSLDVGQKLVFDVSKADISVYGENGHTGETGTLILFYTVNGLRSPESVFDVNGSLSHETGI